MPYADYLKKKGPRIGMSIDLLILFLISVHMFYLKPFAPLFGGEGTFTYFLLMLAYLYIRYLGFSVRFGIAKKMIPLLWITIGIVLSFVPAYVFYGQHIYYSFIAYRHFLCLLALPILFSIRPSRTEIKRALYAFSVIFLFLTVYVTFVMPSWVEVLDGHLFIDEGELVHVLPGPHFVMLAFIFALEDFRRKMDVNYFLRAAFFFLILILVQNRTLLICSMAVIVLAALFNKSAKTRIAAEVLLLMVGIALVVLGNRYFLALWNETVYQLNNPDYNRVRAFMYFTSVKNGPLSFFLGNGFISGRVNPIMQNLMKEGIYNSDLGLIGMWHQFGLIPVITILVIEIRGLSRKHSFLVRACSLFMLLCSMTIAYFVDSEFIIWLCLHLYLYGSDVAFDEAVLMQKKKIERRILRRYRSISSS